MPQPTQPLSHSAGRLKVSAMLPACQVAQIDAYAAER